MPDFPVQAERLTLRMMTNVDARAHGTVVCHLADIIMADASVAEICFTMAPAHHGQGFATEAAGEMVDEVFARTAIHRIVALIDPANAASMRVLEQLGFRYEGTARRAAFVGGQWVDDMRFALLRDDRTDWLARTTTCQNVELVEITPDNLLAVSALATHCYQEKFVAPMARSLSQALVPPLHDDHPVVPWIRAVRADNEIVGFMMVSAPSPGEPVPFLWRFLIDRRHQLRGVGRRAIQLLADEWRGKGHNLLLVSWEEGLGGPRPFYERLGFVPTGIVDGTEIEARLELTSQNAHARAIDPG